jgi:hypothetical protein
MLSKIFTLMLSLSFISCVANEAVRTVQPGDYDLSCTSLTQQLADLGARFDRVDGDSGATGKNIGMAILFWPGIFVNESRSNKNGESVNNRITHLNNIYSKKCLGNQK